jgi:hypothetical protein
VTGKRPTQAQIQAALVIAPKAHSSLQSQGIIMDNGSPQIALLAAATDFPQQMEGALRSVTPQLVEGALRVVTFNRNPPVEGAMQPVTGIGIIFFRHVAQASGFVFDTLDSDRDGMITREEYNAGFDTLDLNKNGKLSREEFNFDSYFSALDKDGDGQLSREEYEAGFGLIDTDNDGKVCRSEFLAAAGPYKIHTMLPAGTASQSGLIHVGDLLFEVNGVSVLGLTAEQVTALILGEPSSPITLSISTPQMALLAKAAMIESKAQQGVEAVSEIQVEATYAPRSPSPPQQEELCDAATDQAQAQEGAEAALSEPDALVASPTPRSSTPKAVSKSRWEPTWQENLAAWNKQRSKK